MNDKLNETLEQLIDRHGLDAVLKALADVCSEKARRIRQDMRRRRGTHEEAVLAKLWQQAADCVVRVRGVIDV